MLLSVIICTYNRENYIQGLLQSLANQVNADGKYEIVFIDNNSSDNTPAICRNFAQNNSDIPFRYFKELNQGLSHARNRGITESAGDVLAFIDDDALAFNNYVAEIFSFFEKNREAVAAGGRIFPKYETHRPGWMSVFLEPVMSVLDLGDKIKPFSAGKFPIGANMIFRKEILAKVGTFRTDLGRIGKKMLGGEEKDIFNRIRKFSNHIYYLPDAKIYHIIPQSRLQFDFLKKQALGIGISERIRAKKSNTFAISVLKEIFKWGASFVLLFFYTAVFKPAKAGRLIKFRYYVSKGMINARYTNDE